MFGRIVRVLTVCMLVAGALALADSRDALAGTFTCVRSAYVSGSVGPNGALWNFFWNASDVVSTASFVQNGTGYYFPASVYVTASGVGVGAQNNYNGYTISNAGWVQYQYSC